MRYKLSSNDIRDQVTLILAESVGVFDVGGIVRDIIDTHGLIAVDDVDSVEFWAIVQAHETLQALCESPISGPAWLTERVKRDKIDACTVLVQAVRELHATIAPARVCEHNDHTGHKVPAVAVVHASADGAYPELATMHVCAVHVPTLAETLEHNRQQRTELTNFDVRLVTGHVLESWPA